MSTKVEKHKYIVKFLVGRVTHRLLFLIKYSKKKTPNPQNKTKNPKQPTEE